MDYYLALKGSVGILLVIFIPGIALSFALYPQKNDLGLIERFAFSLFLGFMPTLVLYFLQKNFSVPVTQPTSQWAVAAVTFIALAVWFYRREEQEE
ncbi:hypothetical protein ACFLRC_00795 [Candidatus Altiarchaeota archaeon]